MGVIDEVLVGVPVRVDVSVVLPLIELLGDAIEEYELTIDDEELGVLLLKADDDAEIVELVVILIDPETDTEGVNVGVMLAREDTDTEGAELWVLVAVILLEPELECDTEELEVCVSMLE